MKTYTLWYTTFSKLKNSEKKDFSNAEEAISFFGWELHKWLADYAPIVQAWIKDECGATVCVYSKKDCNSLRAV